MMQSKNKQTTSSLRNIFSELDNHFRKNWERVNKRPLKEWWPISGKFKPPGLEIAVGCILTQNTNWSNVEIALKNMISEGLTSAKKISECKSAKLENTIKPSGFYRQKAVRLKALAKFILEYDGDFYSSVKSEELLKIKGIGNETADSIILFACGKPEFVVDAYTARIFSRHGIIEQDAKYCQIKKFITDQIERDANLYKESHALLVEHAKKICKKMPLCDACPLSRKCRKIGI